MAILILVWNVCLVFSNRTWTCFKIDCKLEMNFLVAMSEFTKSIDSLHQQNPVLPFPWNKNPHTPPTPPTDRRWPVVRRYCAENHAIFRRSRRFTNLFGCFDLQFFRFPKIWPSRGIIPGWRILWITLVIVSPLSRVAPFPNGLNGLYMRGY